MLQENFQLLKALTTRLHNTLVHLTQHIISHYVSQLPRSKNKPGIERVQAIADILHSALCCHSNETHASTANPSNSAQLDGTFYHSPKLHLGPCSSVGMRRRTDRHTHRYRRPWPLYTLPRLRLTQNVTTGQQSL